MGAEDEGIQNGFESEGERDILSDLVPEYDAEAPLAERLLVALKEGRFLKWLFATLQDGGSTFVIAFVKKLATHSTNKAFETPFTSESLNSLVAISDTSLALFALGSPQAHVARLTVWVAPEHGEADFLTISIDCNVECAIALNVDVWSLALGGGR